MEWLLDHFQVLLFLLLYFGPTIVRLIRRASSNSDAPELELPEEPPVREPQRAMEQVRDERPQPAAERKPGAAPPDWHTTRSAPAATAPRRLDHGHTANADWHDVGTLDYHADERQARQDEEFRALGTEDYEALDYDPDLDDPDLDEDDEAFDYDTDLEPDYADHPRSAPLESRTWGAPGVAPSGGSHHDWLERHRARADEREALESETAARSEGASIDAGMIREAVVLSTILSSRR
jgi:hypothetical protein